MKQYIISLIFICLQNIISAQNISVSSFKLDEMDITANTAGTIVLDQNGEKCALIKVQTTETQLVFDGGALGITKTSQGVGEIWLYVPRGSKHLSISHAKYGKIRYDYPMAIAGAKVYELKISISEEQLIPLSKAIELFNKNDTTAVKAFEIYAERDSTKAIAFLGRCFLNGFGLPKDYDRAVVLLSKAALRGDSYATNGLGFCYQNGYGVPKDIAKAIGYYSRSASQNNELALVNLGVCYLNGNGVAKDYSKAKECFLKSSQLKNAKAFYNLGLIYDEGLGEEINKKTAFDYFMCAAKMDELSSTTKVALCYYMGDGVEKNIVEAKKWALLANRSKNFIAACILGKIYMDEYNLLDAIRVLTEAANDNDAASQCELGLAYLKQGNKAAAIHWITKAADQGNPIGQYSLALFYLYGLGVEKDVEKAMSLIKSSAAQGNVDAKEFLNNINVYK